MIDRIISDIIAETAQSFPSLTVIGPRQSGKTTLIKHIFEDYKYVNLENPDIRLIAEEDPRSLFDRPKIIFDEVQRVPHLFSYIQTYIDTGNYKFILSGSNQFDLNAQISQSLAGRTAIFKLLPLSLKELSRASITEPIDDQILKGFYPAIYDKKQNPTIAYRSYYETYLQKDVRQITNIMDLSHFDRFIRVCAGRVGNLVNYSAISNEVGVSVNTVKSWLSILESSFICFSLKPYFRNINKRLVKSPKLYFYDTGLVSYLLGIENATQVSRDPLRGALFENLVVSEFVKTRYNQGKDMNGFFFRDNNGLEVDYFDISREGVQAFEIKSASTYHPGFRKNLNQVSKIDGLTILQNHLIYTGESLSGPEGLQIHNYLDYLGT